MACNLGACTCTLSDWTAWSGECARVILERAELLLPSVHNELWWRYADAHAHHNERRHHVRRAQRDGHVQ
jgi:hypothetical protein